MRLALDVRLKLPSHRAHRAHTAHSIVGQAAEDPVLVLEAREHFFTHGNVPRSLAGLKEIDGKPKEKGTER